MAGEPKAKHVAGWIETIRLEPWGEVVKAKLDTGAQTSSIHASKIQRFKRKGESWVRYELVLDYKGKEIRIPDERPVTRRVLIKAAGRPHDSRVAVDLEFCFNGRRYRGPFTLANRETMLYPVLLGRSFLEGRILVDSEETYLTEPGCKPKPRADADPDPDKDDGKESDGKSPKATQVEPSRAETEADDPEGAGSDGDETGNANRSAARNATKAPKASEGRD